MSKRTYELEDEVIEWIDEFANENSETKSDVVNRAVKVYAAKVQAGDWSDPRFSDTIDKRFSRSDM